MYEIEYFPTVIAEDIPALPKTMRQRIEHAIESRLAVDPVAYGKPLQYSLKGQRRLRVGDYRVIYRIDVSKRQVTIISIAHRKDVYEGS